MLSNKEIRALSREQLKGHWLKFALINLVMMILAGGCSYIASDFVTVNYRTRYL